MDEPYGNSFGSLKPDEKGLGGLSDDSLKKDAEGELSIKHGAAGDAGSDSLAPVKEEQVPQKDLGESDFEVDHSKKSEQIIKPTVSPAAETAPAVVNANASKTNVTPPPAVNAGASAASMAQPTVQPTINSAPFMTTNGASTAFPTAGSFNAAANPNPNSNSNPNTINSNMMFSSQAPTSSVGAGLKFAPAEDKKPKKKMIIAIIAVIAIIIIALVVGIVIKNNSGSKQQKKVTGSVKEAFNSYVNYVWYGEDNMNDFELNELYSTTPYFLKVKEDGSMVDSYLGIANEKYNLFSTLYYQDNVGGETTSEMSAFFQDFIGAKTVSTSKLFETYINGGSEAAKDLIDQTYKDEGVDSEKKIYGYIDLKEEMDELTLNMYIQIDHSGCIEAGKIIPDCYTPSDELENEMNSISEQMQYALEKLQQGAFMTLEAIYGEIYGGGF